MKLKFNESEINITPKGMFQGLFWAALTVKVARSIFRPKKTTYVIAAVEQKQIKTKKKKASEKKVESE